MNWAGRCILSLSIFLFSGLMAGAQTFLWVHLGGGNGYNIGLSVATDLAGNSYVTGY